MQRLTHSFKNNAGLAMRINTALDTGMFKLHKNSIPSGAFSGMRLPFRK